MKNNSWFPGPWPFNLILIGGWVVVVAAIRRGNRGDPMTCPNCNKQSTDIETCSACGTPMSVASDSLDQLVQQASVPNLAALFQTAKDQGLIVAQVAYGHTP